MAAPIIPPIIDHGTTATPASGVGVGVSVTRGTDVGVAFGLYEGSTSGAGVNVTTG